MQTSLNQRQYPTSLIDNVTPPLQSEVVSYPSMERGKEAIKAWSNKEPILISLLAPGKAEVFFDKRDTEEISRLPAGATFYKKELTKKDHGQAGAYLQGYFKGLHIQELTLDQQIQVLELARQLIPSRFKKKDMQQCWAKTINYYLPQVKEDENL
jgi:hypothetical protein